MTLPAMDRTLHILPPHLGDPTVHGAGSPYPVSIVEFTQAFVTKQPFVKTPERRAIMQGFLDLRSLLRSEGFIGFQLLAGSFVENIESSENRPPKDIDVATVYQSIFPGFEKQFISRNPIFQDQDALKTQYRTDHYFVDLAIHPTITFEFLRYWLGLFTHRRGDATYRYGLWKGIARVELTQNDSEDQQARQLLQGGTMP